MDAVGSGRNLSFVLRRGSTARRLIVALAVVSAAAAAFAWFLRSGVLGPSGTVALDDCGEAAAAVVAVAFTVRAARRAAGRDRAGWTLLAAAAAAWGLGQVIWTVSVVGLGIRVSAPSISDVGYLAAIPLEVAAILAFPLTAARTSAVLRILLDGLLIATSMFLISYMLVLQPVISVRDAHRFALAINLSYPVGDVATCAVVFLALSRAGRGLRLTLSILGIAFLAVAAGDSNFAYGSAQGTYATGTWLDTGWVLGFLLVAAAAALSDPTVVEPPADVPESALQAAVPYLVLALTIVVVIVYFARGGSADPGIRWSAIVIISIAAAGLFIHREELLWMLRRSRGTEAILAANQEVLGRLLETAPAALFSVAPDGLILLHRGSILEGLVEAPGGMEGRQVRDLLSDYPTAVAVVETALAGERSTVTVDAWPNIVEIVCTPVRGASGDVESVTGIALDVTARLGFQRALAENEAKTRLLATVSHELRTPLNVVLGFTDLLALPQTGPLNVKQARYLGHVSSGGRHLLHLVNGILDFSKLAAGGTLDVQVTAVDAAVAIVDAVEKVRPLAGRRRLEVATQPGADYAVVADPVRLDQILLNLLSNALKSTEDEGTVILAAVSSGGWVKITVTDDGVGIAAGDLERIFDEYIQVAGGRAASDGTGLGLPVSRRLAELMKGTLTVASELGRGSTFSLNLPAATAAPAGPAPAV